MEIYTIGGYNEVGKNMTAVRVNNEFVILDMGLYLEKYIKLTEDEDIVKIGREHLVNAGAIPDISPIEEFKKEVKAIIPTHAHLDHVGAIPYLANIFNAPILATHFTTEVIHAILKDEEINLKNPIKALATNCVYHLSDNIKIEFINVTHSTPQTVMVALHTKEGIVLYANDFKFDRYPTLGKKPNFERLKELGKKGILALIVDSTYSGDARKMPSESVARQMLKDVMLGTNSRDKSITVTTFSSHIARLKSIVEFGKRLNRRIIFLGRSLAKYTEAAEKTKIVNFSKEVEIVKYGKQIRNRFRHIKKEQRRRYVFVVTGHQGEPKSTLVKMADNQLDFKFSPEDHVIFSCNVIPAEINIENRERLEKTLKKHDVRIFKDIHVSGHAAKEDLRDLINLVKPRYIVPAHGNRKMTSALSELAFEMGYKGSNVHVMSDGGKLRL